MKYILNDLYHVVVYFVVCFLMRRFRYFVIITKICRNFIDTVDHETS
jgi:hypothetical protein